MHTHLYVFQDSTVYLCICETCVTPWYVYVRLLDMYMWESLICICQDFYEWVMSHMQFMCAKNALYLYVYVRLLQICARTPTNESCHACDSYKWVMSMWASFIYVPTLPCVTPVIHVCARTSTNESCHTCDSWVTSLIHTCHTWLHTIYDMTCQCVNWLTYESHMWHHSSICVAWLIHPLDMTQLCVSTSSTTLL